MTWGGGSFSNSTSSYFVIWVLSDETVFFICFFFFIYTRTFFGYFFRSLPGGLMRIVIDDIIRVISGLWFERSLVWNTADGFVYVRSENPRRIGRGRRGSSFSVRPEIRNRRRSGNGKRRDRWKPGRRCINADGRAGLTRTAGRASVSKFWFFFFFRLNLA